MIKIILDTLVRSVSRTIGRVLGYIIIGLIAFFVYNTFFKADTIDIYDMPLKSDYIDYFSRLLDNKKYFNTNYLAFTHKCDNSTCYTLLTGDIQKGVVKEELEKIEVDVLPTPGEDTQNKIYIQDNKYFITEKITSEYTPIPLNEELKNIPIYFNCESLSYEFLDSIYSKDEEIFTVSTIVSSSLAGSLKYSFFKNTMGNIGDINHYVISFPLPNPSSYNRQYVVFLEDGSKRNCKESFETTLTHSITEVVVPELSQYFSLTPFESSYVWKETQMPTSNIGYTCKKCDYITFKENDTTTFDTGTYENLDIIGNVFYTNLDNANLERGNNYEKVITLSLLLIISFYIVYKLLRK